MRRRLLLLLFSVACAEKRHAPAPTSAQAPPTDKKESTSTQATSTTTDKEIPASFLSSSLAKSFVRLDLSPASDGALTLIEALDLNEDGINEVLLVPGPRFCGTGGCMLPKVFQEKDAAWIEISALLSTTPQSADVTSASILSEVVGGFHSVSLTRRAKSDWVLRFDGNVYQLVPEAPTSDRVSPEKSASLMLAGSHFDKARNIAPVGLWDKNSTNKGAKISVQITTPSKQMFSISLGVIGSPDEWHQAFFPVDFKDAPETLEPGLYQVEYRLNDKTAATSEFTVK